MSLDILGAADEKKSDGDMPRWAMYTAAGATLAMVGWLAFSVARDSREAEPTRRAGESWDHYIARRAPWVERQHSKVRRDLMDWRTKRGLDNDWAKRA